MGLLHKIRKIKGKEAPSSSQRQFDCGKCLDSALFLSGSRYADRNDGFIQNGHIGSDLFM